MNDQKSIKESLKIIRKALEDDTPSIDQSNENILILNKLIQEDGTINIIDDNIINKDDVKEILNQKISEVFEKHLDNWLDKNIPNYLDKYFKNK